MNWKVYARLDWNRLGTWSKVGCVAIKRINVEGQLFRRAFHANRIGVQRHFMIYNYILFISYF